MEKITWTCNSCGDDIPCALTLSKDSLCPTHCPYDIDNEDVTVKWVSEVIERDEIMNILKSRLDAEMCDFADRFDMKHGDVSPTWQVQYDDLVMQLANLVGVWIEDNSDVGVKI